MGGQQRSCLVRCVKTSGVAKTNTDHTSYDSKQSGMPFIGRLIWVAVDKYFDRIETSGFGPITGGREEMYDVFVLLSGVYLVANRKCISAKRLYNRQVQDLVSKRCQDLANVGPSWNLTPLHPNHSCAWGTSPRFQHPGMASHSPASFTTITKATIR